MWRAQRSRAGASDDAGLTVIELIVAMGIFTVVIGVFLGSLVSMSRTTQRSTDVVDAADSLRMTFQMLDTQVRYASAINRPGVGTSGSWYVEFIATDLPNAQQPLCTQWRFDPTAQTMAFRTWNDVASATVGDWRVVSSGVTTDIAGGVEPFVFSPAGGPHARQSLDVSVSVASSAASDAPDELGMSTTFVARNSSSDSPSNADADGNGTSDTPICASHLSRP